MKRKISFRSFPGQLTLSGLFLLALLFVQCRRAEPQTVSRDTTITPRVAVTRLLVDSSGMEKYMAAHLLDDSLANRLRNFYNSRNYQFAWVSEHGLTEQAKVFYDLDNSYITASKDSAPADQQLHRQLAELISKDTTIRGTSPALIDLELSLTQHFFNFVTTAYGGKLDPAALQWYIPRKKIDAAALLDSLVAKKGHGLEDWEPVNHYYKALHKELARWNTIAQKPWEPLNTHQAYTAGAGGKSAAALRRRLIDFGALAPQDTAGVLDGTTTEAVRTVQKQLGLPATGSVNRTLIDALNVPATVRIQQMLINLERTRWTPQLPEGQWILVNIPEYRLHVFEGGNEVMNMGIVVGKAANKTVIFSKELKNIVFSPYWNIPESIVKTEVLPAIRANRNYLAQKHMEQYGVSQGVPLIRQLPGNSNSLGRVKFLFPNTYNIYLHDTPAKSLFAEQVRAFSHGCIRLAEPKKLAEYLLEDQPGWTSARIDQAMNSEKEVWVTVKQHIPVYITYFTSWVDKNGLINFRDDIYAHDQEMAKQMFPAEE